MAAALLRRRLAVRAQVRRHPRPARTPGKRCGAALAARPQHRRRLPGDRPRRPSPALLVVRHRRRNRRRRRQRRRLLRAPAAAPRPQRAARRHARRRRRPGAVPGLRSARGRGPRRARLAAIGAQGSAAPPPAAARHTALRRSRRQRRRGALRAGRRAAPGGYRRQAPRLRLPKRCAQPGVAQAQGAAPGRPRRRRLSTGQGGAAAPRLAAPRLVDRRRVALRRQRRQRPRRRRDRCRAGRRRRRGPRHTCLRCRRPRPAGHGALPAARARRPRALHGGDAARLAAPADLSRAAGRAATCAPAARRRPCNRRRRGRR